MKNLLFLLLISFNCWAAYKERPAYTNTPFRMIEEHNRQICSHLGYCGQVENHLRSEISHDNLLVCICKK